MTQSLKYISAEGITAGSVGTEPYPVAGLGTTAESAVLEDALDTTGEAVVEEVITGAVMITGVGLVVETREVVVGVELVTTGEVVGRVEAEVTAVAAARLEAW